MAAGLVPGIGAAADVTNVLLSLGAGDTEGATDALIAAIPFIGLGAGGYKTIKSLKRGLRSGPMKRQLNRLIDAMVTDKKVKADLKGKITKTLKDDKVVKGIKDRNKKGIEKILKEKKSTRATDVPPGSIKDPRYRGTGLVTKERYVGPWQRAVDTVSELPADRLRRRAKPKPWGIDPGVKPWNKWAYLKTKPGIRQVPQPGRTWGDTFQDIKQLAPIAAGVGAGAAILDHVLDSNAASTNQPTLTPEERERAVIDQTERTTRESMMQKFIEGGGY
jgi:hypothetical protein